MHTGLLFKVFCCAGTPNLKLNEKQFGEVVPIKIIQPATYSEQSFIVDERRFLMDLLAAILPLCNSWVHPSYVITAPTIDNIYFEMEVARRKWTHVPPGGLNTSLKNAISSAKCSPSFSFETWNPKIRVILPRAKRTRRQRGYSQFTESDQPSKISPASKITPIIRSIRQAPYIAFRALQHRFGMEPSSSPLPYMPGPTVPVAEEPARPPQAYPVEVYCVPRDSDLPFGQRPVLFACQGDYQHIASSLLMDQNISMLQPPQMTFYTIPMKSETPGSLEKASPHSATSAHASDIEPAGGPLLLPEEPKHMTQHGIAIQTPCHSQISVSTSTIDLSHTASIGVGSPAAGSAKTELDSPDLIHYPVIRPPLPSE